MVLRLWLVNFAWDLGRYVVAAGSLFLLVWVVWKQRFTPRLIAKRWAEVKDMKREIAYSLSTAVVFSLVGTVVKLIA